ncbi:MAG: hypothetical protein KatS3mg011_2049 [Acidimicrobiia bacterium]|nr:MAG: hypothetical protein KatS3mg011_2049 [Acidimicrobiia bacterium]
MRHRLLATLMIGLAACGGGVGLGGPLTTIAGDPVVTTPTITTTSEAPTTTDGSHGPGSTTTTEVTSTTTTTIPPTTDVVAYFLIDQGGTRGRPGPFLVPVLRRVPQTVGVARAALEQLISGPTASEQKAGIASAVPPGTLLLGVSIADGTAVVDLSADFDAGGGTFSQRARLAQLVFTLTRFPTVDRVELRLDGEPVEVFSSEGIVIDGPMERMEFEDLVPTILVEDPPYGGTIGTRARVTGIAAVFEATFHMAVLDAAGEVLAEPPYVMTDEGNGWGSFDVTLDVPITQAQWGTLRVWNYSAEDGRVEALREYPVWLDPEA